MGFIPLRLPVKDAFSVLFPSDSISGLWDREILIMTHLLPLDIIIIP